MKKKGLSLRLTLILPFTLLTVTAVLTTGQISQSAASRSVSMAIAQLSMEVGQRIAGHLETYLRTPHRINAINAEAMQLGLIPARDPRALERYFLRQIPLFSDISSIYFGNTDGGIANGGKEAHTDQTYYIATENFRAGDFVKYAVEKNGERGRILARVPHFDARLRPWFTLAKAADRPVWSPVYILFTGEDMALSASQPVRDPEGNFIGVAAVDVFLSHLKDFLKSLRVGKTGIAFLMEPSGLLLASSHHERDFIPAQNGVPAKRLSVLESPCPITRAAGLALENQGGIGLREARTLTFEADGEPWLLQTLPISDTAGIRWIACVLIPERDFMEEILKARNSTFFFILMTLLLTILTGLVLTGLISRPILRLNAAAAHMASDGEPIAIEAAGPVEIRKLTEAFIRMDTRLRSNLQALNREIAERGALADTLRENARHTQAILDNILDGIITIDPWGTVASFSLGASRIFGYAAEEVIGRNIRMLMPEPYHSAHDGYLARYREGGRARVIGVGREVSGKRKNGEVFPLDLAVSELERKNTRLFIGIVRDISERKQVDAMKDAFVSTVSHELRTPLTAIKASMGLALGGAMGALPENVRQLLQIAQNNTQRLTLLINDLLDVEKLIAGKMTFDLKLQPLLPLVQAALEENQPYAAKHGVHFTLSCGDEAIRVRVDSLRLQQVLANFLSNAVKFSPPGREVAVSITTRGDKVQVSVRDQGPGIPESFRDRIFEKFSQADATDQKQKGGTGLGLAISREIIRNMDGEIGFDSEEDQGATFWFILTRVKGEEDHDTA